MFFLVSHETLQYIEKNLQLINKSDKELVASLDYEGIEFPVSEKSYLKMETINNISINVFGYKNKQAYPIYLLKENYENHMILLQIVSGDNSHNAYIKDLIDSCIIYVQNFGMNLK